MNKITHGSGMNKTTDYHPNVPLIQKPKIRKRFKVIEGVKYYIGIGTGKMFRADLFDKYWTGGSAAI